jgi:hypothetical protein
MKVLFRHSPGGTDENRENNSISLVGVTAEIRGPSWTEAGNVTSWGPPTFQWALGAPSPGVKRPEHEGDLHLGVALRVGETVPPLYLLNLQ